MNGNDKRIEWKARYDAWRASSLSVSEWCRNENIKTHQMYYWIRKFREESASKNPSSSATQWLAVDVHDPPTSSHTDRESVLIHVGTLSVEVRPGTNMELFSKVVHLLQKQ